MKLEANVFPSYTPIFEMTIRRLKSLRDIGEKDTGKLSDEDTFLFLIAGNINLRLNTIFFLLENGITDGVLPLLRTLFELQLAFHAYSTAENKEKYIEFYFHKKNFESSNKWDKMLKNEKTDLFTDDEQETVASFAKEFKKTITDNSKVPIFKLWYEHASEKTAKELSDEFFSSVDYFSNYDEPSNWVHPQRLEKNLDSSNFDQQIPYEFFELLIKYLIWNVDLLGKDMSFMAKHFKISKSPRLVNYGQKIVEFSEELQKISTFKRDQNS